MRDLVGVTTSERGHDNNPVEGVNRTATEDDANKSKRSQGRGMLHVYRLVFHTGLVADGIDSARRRFVPRPIAIGPIRSRVPYCALRAMAQCGGHANLAG
jgi:hypothetical protein